jgi:hypothetical protein
MFIKLGVSIKKPTQPGTGQVSPSSCEIGLSESGNLSWA